MKTLTVIDVLSSGGAQRQIVNLSIGLSKRGHTVTLFYAGSQKWRIDELKNAGVSLQNASSNPLLYLFALYKHIRSARPDSVISFLTSTSILATLSCLACFNKPRLIVSERNALNGSLTPIRLKIALWLYRFSDNVVTNAWHVKAEIDQYSKKLAVKTKVIWNGVDAARFDSNQYHGRNKPMNVLAMGTLDPVKGHSDLVEAMGILGKKYQEKINVSWAVRRSNNLMEHEIAHQRQMDLRLKELKLESDWQWLDEQKDVVSILDKCDALAHPSVRDGLPNSVCEALASGKPVFAASILDGPLLLDGGKNGFLFEPGNPESLAEQLHIAINMSDTDFGQMSASAKAFATSALSVDSLVENYLQLIEHETQ